MFGINENDPFEVAQRLRTILLNHATGSNENNSEYARLRLILTCDLCAKKHLPQFINWSYTLADFWEFIKNESSTYEGRRQYLRSQFGPLLEALEGGKSGPADVEIDKVLVSLNSETVREAWEKALARRSSDPEGAITSARTLLESVCKYILDNQEVDYSDKEKLPSLYGKVAKTLNLAPADYSEETFKRILGGCFTVVEGLGSLRNQLGDAHGKGKRKVRPADRHAELAVNMAGAVAVFLINTWQSRATKEQ